MSQADVDVVEQFLKAFQAGDVETAFGLIHPDFVIDEGYGLPYAGVFTGLAGLQEVVTKIMTPMEMVVDDYTVSDGGDCAITRLTMTFTSRSSGRSLTIPGVEIYNTKDGQVSKIDVYYKSTHAMAELAAE
ncbi:MAG TPA: nuclear transport factor 2 family protein [Acidimicrobiia bacterium]|nr:nuclear transport factor 2 family protein [Acidimicrobiia bacterium]